MKARLALRRCCDIGSQTPEELLRQREERCEVSNHEHGERAQQREGRGDLLMWRKGVDEVTIAKEIQSLAKRCAADLQAAQKDEVQARSM